jgi:small subunit ribosomal protein S18
MTSNVYRGDEFNMVLSRKRIKDKKKDLKKNKNKRFRKKICKLCTEKQATVDYKDVARLQRYITEKGKMIPRRITGSCAKHQRCLSRAIKQARQISLLPYVVL